MQFSSFAGNKISVLLTFYACVSFVHRRGTSSGIMLRGEKKEVAYFKVIKIEPLIRRILLKQNYTTYEVDGIKM